MSTVSVWECYLLFFSILSKVLFCFVCVRNVCVCVVVSPLCVCVGLDLWSGICLW